jgi:hypothetical protein
LTLSAKEAEACIWATTIPRFTNQMWLEIWAWYTIEREMCWTLNLYWSFRS